MLDLAIIGGLVVDGTGKPGTVTDVGVIGDRIAHVGPLWPDMTAATVVDAAGLVLAPGFIDIHTHSDCSLQVNRAAESSVRQGVTTELLGNCGMGCAPIVNPEHLPLVNVEYRPEIEVRWRSFGEWLDKLQAGGLAINVASLVGHGPVRLCVMGLDSRPATPAELDEMGCLVGESMAEGAFGLSSGLEYAPGKSSEPEELSALAAVVARGGGLYATHIRNRDYHYEEAIEEAITTAAVAGVSLQISHIAPRWGAPPEAGPWALERVDRANGEGLDIWFDNHPYVCGRGLVSATLPAAAFVGGLACLRERLNDPVQRAAWQRDLNPQWKLVKEGRWHLLTVFEAPHNRHLEGQTIQEIAITTGREPWDVLCDLLLAEWRNPGALYWSAPVFRQEDVDASFRHPRGMIISDGSSMAPYGPYGTVRHVYAYGWASHVLRRYVRERGLLSLEEAVHKMSGLAARRLGLADRGVIAVGQKADLVLLDMERIQDRATFEHPIGYPDGIRHVWVNGVRTVANGEHTGARSGKVLRHRA